MLQSQILSNTSTIYLIILRMNLRSIEVTVLYTFDSIFYNLLDLRSGWLTSLARILNYQADSFRLLNN